MLSTQRHTETMIVFLVTGKLANAEMRKKFAILCFNLFQIYFKFIYRIFIRVLCLLCQRPIRASVYIFLLRDLCVLLWISTIQQKRAEKNPSNQYSISK